MLERYRRCPLVDLEKLSWRPLAGIDHRTLGVGGDVVLQRPKNRRRVSATNADCDEAM
jgi:hypothetical protein